MTRPAPPGRDQFAVFYEFASRWHDNDCYGHFNNTVYYAYYDSAVNRYLIEQGGLDIQQGSHIGLVVESGCRFHTELGYPDRVEVGIRVARLGNSSVRYEVALFKAEETQAAADGFFTHVFVDRQQRQPMPLQGRLRQALSDLVLAAT
ncbi:acyl-CoA thioesterase [Aestuariirhabdus sp. Z084]|uniref:acyl-CoA thioesterase n=1 Tax=Aestuariirhabdus haliotis TaxID=2918751 RepID=UPI00201B3FCC|nr:thioesterase family protein [Aestuariirhabdus haliotis]MCL6414110.1 acyl-CoA thioesterase [Aestuariirhabdus haliotis]MCL6418042.1 acyl-CoA thioesterase [Aestuariirhabdus haliotis]